jgi:hypothetical protein
MDGPDYENAPDTTNLHLKTEEPEYRRNALYIRKMGKTEKK